MQTFHSSPWIEGGLLNEATINYKQNVVNRDTGFSYIGCQNDFSSVPGSGLKDLDLHITGESGVNRAYYQFREFVAQILSPLLQQLLS